MDGILVDVRRFKIDADAFYRMAEVGILDERERVELIDGELIEMSPIGQGHEEFMGRFTQTLVLAFGERVIVLPQGSLRLDRLNVPEPDFVVLRAREDFYGTGARPGPADVLLLIEVSDSSLRYDREVKLPLFARAGIAEAWIVDVKRRALEVYRQPGDAGYGQMTTHHPGETIALALMPDVELRVERLLGGPVAV